MNEMEERLSGVLGVNAQAVNIKATTNEGLGFLGREEGIAAYAVVSLVQQ
jgi:2-C-methyl-D-erythritol 2,4-cyclodiphosphate synthase